MDEARPAPAGSEAIEAACREVIALYGARALDNVDLSRLDAPEARARVLARGLLERGDARAYVLARRLLALAGAP